MKNWTKYLVVLLVLSMVLSLVACKPNEDEPSKTTPEVTPEETPNETEPNETEPNETEPNATEPNATEPNATEPNATEPNATEPNATEPNATEPNATEPNATEPTETEPTETEPTETEPTETEDPGKETEPTETEPAGKETEPTETEPVETDPVETEPVETEPVETEPVETEPVETEPVETEPVETEPAGPERPTDPTWEDDTTEKGNYIYVLDITKEAIAVDGVLEPAYFEGVYLTAEVALPPTNDYFDVFFIVTDTHVHVFYEFHKTEIFWDDTYPAGSRYHLDCVDFVFNAAGLEAIGTEFRIFAGVPGGVGTAIEAGAIKAGVDNYFVKHTEEGYNVEFSIPLEKVAGIHTDGNKKFSFTALSTITYEWNEGEAPKRAYATATNALGTDANTSKANPSIIVINGTASEEELGYEVLADGRYKYTLEQATAITQDGVKDDLYENGIHFTTKYYDDGTIATGAPDFDYEKNCADIYVAANAEHIYVFFEVKDDTKYFNNGGATGTSYWYNDCVEIFYNVSGETAWSSIRFSSFAEGTDHYVAGDANSAPYGSSFPGGLDAAILESYTVKFTDAGYNVEVTLDRSALTDGNTFSFLPVITFGVNDNARAYAYGENGLVAAGNSAKNYMNVIEIVDLVEDEEEIINPSELVVGDNQIIVTDDVEITFTAPAAGKYVISAADGETNATLALPLGFTTEPKDLPYEFTLEEGESITFIIGSTLDEKDTIDLVIAEAAEEEPVNPTVLKVGVNKFKLTKGTFLTLAVDAAPGSYVIKTAESDTNVNVASTGLFGQLYKLPHSFTIKLGKVQEFVISVVNGTDYEFELIIEAVA